MDASIHGLKPPQVPSQLQRPVGAPDVPPTRRDIGQLSEKPGGPDGNRVSDKSRVLDGSSISTLEKSLPIAILKDSGLVRTEWAWRRLLTDIAQTMHGQETFQANSNSSIPEKTSPELTKAIQTLWQELASVVIRGGQGMRQPDVGTLPVSILREWQAANQTSAAPSSGDLGMVSFHTLRNEHLHSQLPDKIRSWILEDRFVAATHTSEAPVQGSGVWFGPGANLEGQTNVVRWKAERHSKPDPRGALVHLIQVVVPYDGQPVRVHLISAHSAVSIHVSTNHKALQNRLAGSADAVSASLAKMGWQLDRWSVGTLEEGTD